jgi:hypothetical protein
VFGGCKPQKYNLNKMQSTTDNIVNYSTLKQLPATDIAFKVNSKINPVINSNASIPPTVTDRVLETGKPILIAIEHYKTGEIASKGMLWLRYDKVIDWTDADGTELLTSLFPRFKQMMGFGWSVHLAYPSPNPVWGKYDLDPIQYLADRVIIPVEPCNFRLGGSR